MSRKIWMFALALALVPASALAGDMSYTYVESAWLSSDSDGNGSGSGPALGVSFGVSNLVHIVGRYNDVDFDPVESTTWGFGAGVHHSLNQTFDIVGELAYVDMDVEVPVIGGVGDTGYSVCAGVRAQVSERFEVEGGIEHMDVGDLGDDTLIAADARWNINQHFAVGAGYKFGDNDTGFVGIRYSFGQR